MEVSYNMLRLIASDLDGTLLRNGAQTLPEETVPLIRQLLDKGIYFATATGRQYHNLQILFAPIKDRIFYITENGSLVFADGKVIARGGFSQDLSQRILTDLSQEPGIETMVSTERCCYICDRSKAFQYHVLHELKNKTTVCKDLLHIPEPVIKIAIYDTTQNDASLEKILQRYKSAYRGELKVVTSGNSWIDFIAPNANKGTALQALLDYLHLAPEECMVFGDQYNDLEMLKLAGTSYAMTTCAPGVEKYADYQTDTVEEILKELLDQLDR